MRRGVIFTCAHIKFSMTDHMWYWYFVDLHMVPVFRYLPVFLTVYPKSPSSKEHFIYTNSPGLSRSLPDTTLISRSPVQVTKSPGSNRLLSFTVLQFKFSPFFPSKFVLFCFIVRFLGHFCTYLVTDKVYFIITMMKMNFDSMSFKINNVLALVAQWWGKLVPGGH